MGNSTSIDLSGFGKKPNNTNNTSDESSGASGLGFSLPQYRPKQSLEDITIQSWTACGLQLIIIVLNIMMIVVLNIRFFRSIPHIILNNVLVVDLLSGLLPGLVWSILGSLNSLPWQYLLPFACDIQGFLNNALFSVFLLTIYLLSASQFLAIVSNRFYSQMFKSQMIPRMLLLAAWLLSFLFASFPIIAEWGKYDAYDANCWMAWVTGNDVIVSFNIFTIVITLGPAAITTGAALVIVIFSLTDANPESSPSVKSELVIIAAIQLIIFTALWLTLSVLNMDYLDAGYKGVDFKIIMILFFFYYCRGLWNPIVCLLVSKEIRSAFVDVIFRCRCKSNRARVAPANGQSVEAGASMSVVQ